MPALDGSVVADLTERLNRYIRNNAGYSEVMYLTSGGSAAIFKVRANGDGGYRVFKAFDPRFFNGESGAAERRRLDVQRKFLNHPCPYVVQTFRIEEAEGTAFTEMEFVDWPQLTTVLDSVPDAAVIPLITQLVAAVKYLDSLGVVHRDIKPENIHVSPDFMSLKLLDLGVAREIDQCEDPDAAATDHGNQRPFLATAQYSSPEYLFRLDEPSLKLWRGLNFYQLGAVLYDLIAKRPIFHHEMSLGNRWLVARAVLTKTPSFSDDDPSRLQNLKALAARCLVKDLDTRLQLVGWDDFILEGAKDPLTTLRARLAKGRANIGVKAGDVSASRLEFDRTEFFRRFSEMVRAELLPVCGTAMPLTLRLSGAGESPIANFVLTIDGEWHIECRLSLDWQNQMYERTANVAMCGTLLRKSGEGSNTNTSKIIAVVTISENEMDSATSAASAIAKIAADALDKLDSAPDINALSGVDLMI